MWCTMAVHSVENDVTEAQRETVPIDLKAVRERKGLSLERIAADTKIPRSLLAALERRDLRNFPPGIYARAYARAYAAAVGLSSDDVLAVTDRVLREESLEQIARATSSSVDHSSRLLSRDCPGIVLLVVMAVACLWAFSPVARRLTPESSSEHATPHTDAVAAVAARERPVHMPQAPSRISVLAAKTLAQTSAPRRIERKRPPSTARRSSPRASPMLVDSTTRRELNDVALATELLAARTLVSPIVTDVPAHTDAALSDRASERPQKTVGRAINTFGRGLRKAVLRR